MPVHARRFAVGLLWVVAACGDDGGSSTSLSGADATTAGSTETTDDGTTTGTTEATTADTADATSSDPSETAGGSTGGSSASDPNYPSPVPVMEQGTCPAGFFGPITYDGNGWLCLPPCEGDPPMCPEPQTGDAPAECATSPLSSATPCDSDSDCTVDGEMCGNIGGGQRGCLLPPTHCILRCDEGQTCPDDMSCAAGPGICQYEP
jgi:hypothetical protein